MKFKKTHRLRVILLGALFLALAMAVSGRLYELQYLNHDVYARKADRQHYRRMVIQPQRGAILDRNGEKLAQSIGTFSVYINPPFFRSLHNPPELDQLAKLLAGETGDSTDVMRSKLGAPATRPVARRLSREKAHRLAEILDEYDPEGRGHWLDREAKRDYPKQVASPVIGFCRRGPGGDSDGLAGLELQYDKALRGRKIEARARLSNLRQSLSSWAPDDLRRARGNSLHLTLDARLQEEVEAALAKGVQAHNADAGGVIVMDPRSGAVLAMASYPTFDNNQFGRAPAAHRRNRILTDPLETGSVMKLFTAAMLLDKGYVTPETVIDCEGGLAVVDGRRLRDSPGHYMDAATFREILRHSSNIGMVKAAQALRNPEWYRELREFGFGQPTGIDLPGEGSGILHPLENWTKFSRTSLPMGYEIALTPLQIASALSAVVNGGDYYEPYIVREVRDPSGQLVERHEARPARKLVRPATSAVMRDLMEDIVVQGTGTRARIDGFRIGGKTGTTRKSDVFHRREYIASFAGALPINAPQAVIYVYIDDPKDKYYASQVAAPVFHDVAEASILHLGIPRAQQLTPVPQTEQKRTAPSTLPANYYSPRQGKRLAILGRTPSFQGMSLSQVRENLPPRLKQVRLLGSGIVTDQYPEVGEPFNEKTELVLHFTPRSQTPGNEGTL